MPPPGVEFPEAGPFHQAVQALLLDQLQDFWLDLLLELPVKTHTFHSGPWGRALCAGVGGGGGKEGEGEGMQLHLFMNIPMPPKLGFGDSSVKVYLLQ